MTDPGLPAAAETGLVYICPLGPGNCVGAVGDTSLYIDVSDINITNHYIPIPQSAFFDLDISEGRLFDQARECFTECFMYIGSERFSLQIAGLVPKPSAPFSPITW